MARKNSFILQEPANIAEESVKDVSEFDEDDFIKKFVKNKRMILDDEDLENKHLKQKYRNQSFLIPRENSFTWLNDLLLFKL